MKRVEEIGLCDLVEHPLNRGFETQGEEWEAFVESVREHGVLQPLIVRPLPAVAVEGDDPELRFQIVAGHRRAAAALRTYERVPCLVRELSDKEALEILLIENLERDDLDPVEEARGLVALAGVGMSEQEISARIKRKVAWVRTRQRMLDLGDEVLEAVRRPRGDEKHLTMGAVEEILKVPEEMREEAVELVLFNDLEMGALDKRQSAEVLERCLLEPKRAEAAWVAGKDDFRKVWRDRLADLCKKDDEPVVQVVPWAEREQVRGVEAEERVPLAACAPEAPAVPGALRWLHLAVKHGLAVRVIPADNQEGSRAIVDEKLLRQAEEAAAEHGGQPWLVTKARGTVSRSRGEETTGGAVGEARDPEVKAALGETDEEEPGEEVIEQRMERWRLVNLQPVEQLREMLESGEEKWPEWVPEWVDKFDEEELAEVLKWVMSLVRTEGGAA